MDDEIKSALDSSAFCDNNSTHGLAALPWTTTLGSEALFEQYETAATAANDASYENLYPFIA